MLDTMFSLQGRTVLVTGASSGLGAHFAQVLARAGASVAIGARRADKLDATLQKIKAEGGTAMAVSMDVNSADSVAQALDAIEKELGTITVLINNAGVANAQYCLKVDEESWDFVMDTNVKGVWRVARMVAARCAAQNLAGSIVNVASILGLRVAFGQSTYAVSKAAVVQLSKALAMELATKGIRVNALCPGYFSTEMNSGMLESESGKAMIANTTSKRAGDLHELDGALLLLASDAGSFITGITLPVDGGHLVGSL